MANKAEQIRKLVLAGVSAKEIARQIGCSEMYVYNVKHKAKKAFSSTLKKIDKDLGVKPKKAVKSTKPSVIPSVQSKRHIHALLFVLGLAAGYILLEIVSKI